MVERGKQTEDLVRDEDVADEYLNTHTKFTLNQSIIKKPQNFQLRIYQQNTKSATAKY